MKHLHIYIIYMAMNKISAARILPDDVQDVTFNSDPVHAGRRCVVPCWYIEAGHLGDAKVFSELQRIRSDLGRWCLVCTTRDDRLESCEWSGCHLVLKLPKFFFS